ncbi:hypothetical protein HQ533_01005 [Candidatus Woesearchaeota archaeon]|nr:hypothetical protein [Candidatus Woesearchaeota archaeon]
MNTNLGHRIKTTIDKFFLSSYPAIEEENIPISQEDYFLIQQRNIYYSKDYIKILGYDEVFMTDPETIKTIDEAVKGDNCHKRKIHIQAIFPSNIKFPELAEIAENNAFFQIYTVPLELRNGFMLYDSGCVNFWNLDGKTHFEPEIDKGVIARLDVNNRIITRKTKDSFEKHLQEAYKHMSKN